MRTKVKHSLLIVIGWFFVILGGIGAVLPILPTTGFLIIALSCFAKSSPRFHRMLLENKWFGSSLTQWQKSKTISQNTKHKAMLLIISTFAISIFMLSGNLGLQLILVCLCLILLGFMWRLKESKQ
jgi:uncharacterized membrane protein YbaN (DUF454 family)